MAKRRRRYARENPISRGTLFALLGGAAAVGVGVYFATKKPATPPGTITTTTTITGATSTSMTNPDGSTTALPIDPAAQAAIVAAQAAAVAAPPVRMVSQVGQTKTGTVMSLHPAYRAVVNA